MIALLSAFLLFGTACGDFADDKKDSSAKEQKDDEQKDDDKKDDEQKDDEQKDDEQNECQIPKGNYTAAIAPKSGDCPEEALQVVQDNFEVPPIELLTDEDRVCGTSDLPLSISDEDTGCEISGTVSVTGNEDGLTGEVTMTVAECDNDISCTHTFGVSFTRE